MCCTSSPLAPSIQQQRAKGLEVQHIRDALQSALQQSTGLVSNIKSFSLAQTPPVSAVSRDGSKDMKIKKKNLSFLEKAITIITIYIKFLIVSSSVRSSVSSL